MVRYIVMSGKYSGRRIKVDDEDYEDLKQHSWTGHLMGGGTNPKLYATGYVGAKQFRMEHYLMGSKFIDHVDGNTLNNTRANLRRYPRAGLNGANSKPRSHRTLKYRGVVLEPPSVKKRYRAHITVMSKNHYLGNFKTQREAALAYDEAARKQFGEFARLNFPRKGEQKA